MADAKEVYTTLMEEVCGGNKPYLNTATMDAEHRRVKDKALHQFHSKRKMGGEEFSERYKEQLEKVRYILHILIRTYLKKFSCLLI